ncbi:MAG: cellulase family glycosylhydrolase [Planctomycetes bacterium]|nr:cellulase family glycosylhydrolase [Planctomycetota bacterium]
MSRKVIVLALFLAILAVLSVGCAATGGSGRVPAGQNKNTVHGAIYIPAKAFNAPQMWKFYDPAEARRDMGYAAKINLNSVRVWLSYEYWAIDKNSLESNFNDFLAACDEKGITVYPSLFEGCGEPRDSEGMWDTHPWTGICQKSPAPEVNKKPKTWGKYRKYITWFMENYKDDDRVIAIEVMNEPHAESPKFARAMFLHADKLRGSQPLTIGTSGMGNYQKYYTDLNIDIIQMHDNFPKSEEQVRGNIEAAIAIAKEAGKPLWVAEWQRIRPGGAGFKAKDGGIPEDEKYSNYSSMAPIVQSYEVGTYFWSLMVKPAYLGGQRKNGTINGLFFEDGSVWSLADARAIANDPTLKLPERQIKTFEELMAFEAD